MKSAKELVAQANSWVKTITAKDAMALLNDRDRNSMRMNHKTVCVVFLAIVTLAIAGCDHSKSSQKESKASKESNASKVLFVYQAPGDKTTRVGFFYSADGKEAFSFIRSDGKESSIPFKEIRQMTLTKHADSIPSPCSPSVYPPSDVTVDLQNGGSFKGCIHSTYNLWFIDPEKDQTIELVSTDPTDTTKQSVIWSLGVFKRKPGN